ncbi:MAG: hypothetical protein HXY40_05400 [Chloroflexi bacterium]|nr:hypothetical protein [Chloroflexota bacterium]
MQKKGWILLLCCTLLALAAAPASAQGGGRWLVWLANGIEPGQVDVNAPGQLVWMDSTGAITPIMDVPAPASRVQACGDAPNSPGGNLFMFYVGMQEGTLYALRGADTPIEVARVHALTCLGSGTMRFSSDGARLAYIDYEQPNEGDEYIRGTFRIIDTTSLQPTPLRDGDIENTVDFDLNTSAAAYIRFFTNDRGEVTEAAVNLWNGSATQEVATLVPESENDCRYTSASVALLDDGRILSVLGQRCRQGSDTGTRWKFFVIDPTTRTVEETLSEAAAGQFASESRTNNLYVTADGSNVYFTVPDGVSLNTVGLRRVSLADMAPHEVLARSVVMPRYTLRPYDWSDPASPVLSNDGRWLALAVSTPDNDGSVQVVDFSAPDTPPIALSAGDRGAVISMMAFTQDNTRLLYVAGGTTGNDNSLFALDLASASEFRVSRGRFADGVVSSDGAQVAIMEWQRPTDDRDPLYLALAIIEVNTSAYTPIFMGAEIVDGRVANPRFAYPLTWRAG